MNKTFCDVCEKEVSHIDCWEVQFTKSFIDRDMDNIRLPDVCPECLTKIKEVLKRR